MISWDRVNELKEEVGAEDFFEVVELFLAEVDEVMTRLKTAPDPDTYDRDLHFLKGSALNIGFEALSTLCREKEMRLAQGSAGDLDLEDVFAVYETSKAAFLSDSRIAATA